MNLCYRPFPPLQDCQMYRVDPATLAVPAVQPVLFDPVSPEIRLALEAQDHLEDLLLQEHRRFQWNQKTQDFRDYQLVRFVLESPMDPVALAILVTLDFQNYR